MANGNKPLPGVSQRSKHFETSILSRQNNTQWNRFEYKLGWEQVTLQWKSVVNVKRVEFKLVLILQIGLFWNLVRYKHISNNFFQVVKFSFGLSIWCKRISQLFLMNVLPLKTRDFYEFCAYLNVYCISFYIIHNQVIPSVA